MYVREMKDHEAREFIRFANSRQKEPVVTNPDAVAFVVNVCSSFGDPGDDWNTYVALDEMGNILGVRRERSS